MAQDKVGVALSSAEAELYGLVRASAESLGLIEMYGTHMNGVILGDANAATAIVVRRDWGILDTNYLWIQEKATRGDLEFRKVAGKDNGADLLTNQSHGMRHRAISASEVTVCSRRDECQPRRCPAKQSQPSSRTPRHGLCRLPIAGSEGPHSCGFSNKAQNHEKWTPLE